MSNNVLPDPLNVNVVSPNPLPVDIVSPNPLNVNIVSPDPLPVDIVSPLKISDRGVEGLPVFIQDQTSPVLSVPLLQGRTVLTLASDTVIGSRTITLTAGHGVTDGEIIELADNTVNKFMQSEVVVGGVSGNVITLDQPVNRVYTAAGALVQGSSNNLLVDGSVTPQVFSVLPLPDQSGDMVRIILELRSSNSMDFTTFGGASELINGCVLRIKNQDGTFINLFNFKSNSDFFEQGFDHEFLLPKGGNVINGFVARVTWGGQSKHGVVIRLDGSLGEELQIVIQDDLTSGNTRFHLTAQGHEIQG